MKNSKKHEKEFNKLVSRIKIEIVQVEKEITSQTKQSTPEGKLLLKYLEEIKNYLLEESLNKKALEQYALGIFRVVTDDWNFEQSIIGKRLLDISSNINNLSRL